MTPLLKTKTKRTTKTFFPASLKNFESLKLAASSLHLGFLSLLWFFFGFPFPVTTRRSGRVAQFLRTKKLSGVLPGSPLNRPPVASLARISPVKDSWVAEGKKRGIGPIRGWSQLTHLCHFAQQPADKKKPPQLRQAKPQEALGMARERQSCQRGETADKERSR